MRYPVEWPWPLLTKLTEGLWPGEITLLCGNIGAAKSFTVMECLSSWWKKGEKVAVYMLEDDSEFHVGRLLAQEYGTAGFTSGIWQKDHPEETRAIYARGKEMIRAFGHILTTCESAWPTMDDLVEWAERASVAGARVLVIDPATAPDRGRSQAWVADRSFLMRLKDIIKRYQNSLLIVTHPDKVVAVPDMGSIAGGAAYTQQSHCVLWLLPHKPKESTVGTSVGRTTYTHNRTMLLQKTRSTGGMYQSIGYTFNGNKDHVLKMEEHGVIVE